MVCDAWSTSGGTGFYKWIATYVECPDCKCRGGFKSVACKRESDLQNKTNEAFVITERIWNTRKRPSKKVDV